MPMQAGSPAKDEKEVKCIVQTYWILQLQRFICKTGGTPSSISPTRAPKSQSTSPTDPFPLPRKALAHKRGIRHGVRAGASRREVQLVRAVEPSRGPAHIPEEDVGVLVQEGELLADVLLARVRVAAARLGEHGLAVVGAEPFCEWGEGVVDVVGCALCRGAGVVALLLMGVSIISWDMITWDSVGRGTHVEVLVHVKEDVLGAPVRVGHLEQVWAGFGRQRRGRRVGATRDEQPVVRSHLADGRDGGLDGLSPGRGRDVVGLVHDSKDDVGAVCVLGREGRPQGGEFCSLLRISMGYFGFVIGESVFQALLVVLRMKSVSLLSFVGPPWPMTCPFQRA